jgi:hypothetical protein
LDATARILWLVETSIGVEYTVPDSLVGALPSVVQRIVAPSVVVLMVTVCGLAYAPSTGLKVGVATCPNGVFAAGQPNTSRRDNRQVDARISFATSPS